MFLKICSEEPLKNDTTAPSHGHIMNYMKINSVCKGSPAPSSTFAQYLKNLAYLLQGQIHTMVLEPLVKTTVVTNRARGDLHPARGDP